MSGDSLRDARHRMVRVSSSIDGPQGPIRPIEFEALVPVGIEQIQELDRLASSGARIVRMPLTLPVEQRKYREEHGFEVRDKVPVAIDPHYGEAA